VPHVIDLWLFTTDLAMARRCVAAGVQGLVVDWEWMGKENRQQGADTEINHDTAADLARISALAGAKRICRLNPPGPWTQEEVECALACGATHLMLPMVRSVAEARRFLKYAQGRARCGILVETVEACQAAERLARLPLDFVYLGLNDLAISRGEHNIFAPFANGLAAHLRRVFKRIAFGVGGLTVVDGGDPIPCLRLMRELAGLQCDFTFLRRSFRRDIVRRDVGWEVQQIQHCWRRFAARGPRYAQHDHEQFIGLVERLAA
jgi:2-keto-3-deoxy-L-rhamnonate aldolase RhmA